MEEIKFYHIENPFGYLSNYSDHPILIDGVLWKTSEHYYQANKFEDKKIMEEIRNTDTPKEASKIGRSHNELIREDWTEIKDEVMEKVIRAKVEQHKEIQKELISTGNTPIIEDSPIDSYWGCGNDGKGLNKLGKIWMKVRGELMR